MSLIESDATVYWLQCFRISIKHMLPLLVHIKFCVFHFGCYILFVCRCLQINIYVWKCHKCHGCVLLWTDDSNEKNCAINNDTSRSMTMTVCLIGRIVQPIDMTRIINIQSAMANGTSIDEVVTNVTGNLPYDEWVQVHDDPIGLSGFMMSNIEDIDR